MDAEGMMDAAHSERRLRRRNSLLGEASEGATEAPSESTEAPSEALSYRDAGVDIDAGDEAVRRIAPLARATHRPEVLGGIGAFAGFVRVPAGYREPVLVSSTDGVGSKLKIAFAAERHDTVGIDLVAMGVNDVLVHGAEPLYFLDYIGIGRLDPARVEALVRGVAEGCRRAGCALVGGETAELPDLYADGEYDLAGFAVGVVERDRIVDGAGVKPGDVVLGLASSGLHSNGYSLARRIVFDVLKLRLDAPLPGTGRAVADALLEPTRIYAAAVRAALAAGGVTAMAHITGGGLTGNIPRVVPDGCRAVVRRAAWRIPPIFETLREAGRVADAEMLKTFNLGVGYVVIARPTEADRVRDALEGAGETVWPLGEVVAGARGVELV
jgi:phosphoribosylformylglycinamidine cyclo-ligase